MLNLHFCLLELIVLRSTDSSTQIPLRAWPCCSAWLSFVLSEEPLLPMNQLHRAPIKADVLPSLSWRSLLNSSLSFAALAKRSPRTRPRRTLWSGSESWFRKLFARASRATGERSKWASSAPTSRTRSAASWPGRSSSPGRCRKPRPSNQLKKSLAGRPVRDLHFVNFLINFGFESYLFGFSF